MSKAKKSGVIPAIKKDIQAFILEERGDIHKQTMISLGALLAGLEAMSLFSKTASAQSITAKHSHCDPTHCSGGGWHSNCGGCTHTSGSGWGSGNPSHMNNIVLNYG